MKYLCLFRPMALALLLSLSFSGCVFYNEFQSPKVLDKGETIIGVGSSGIQYIEEDDSGGFFGISEVHARFNLGKRTDVGLRATFGAIGGDLKFQVFDRNPFYGAVSIGGSGAYAGNATLYTITPAFIIGTENIYGGVKYTKIGGRLDTNENANDVEYELVKLGTAVFFGGQMGRGRVKFVPEIGLYTNQDGQIFTFGGAVQLHLK